MRRVKNFFLTVLFASMVMTTNNSCESKCDTLVLCDLAFSTAAILQPEVAIGAKLILNNVITNLESECERERAEENEKKTNAYYRANANSSWEQVQFSNGGTITYDVIVPTQALGMGESEEREEGYNFQTEGQYMFALEADTYNVLEEENESNNGADSNTGSINSKKSGSNTLIITVYDPTNSGQYKRKSNEPVVVEYLGSNLIGKY